MRLDEALGPQGPPDDDDRGLPQVVRLDLPVPGLAAGAMAMALGYRARALVMTGEVPTITPQPAARSAER